MCSKVETEVNNFTQEVEKFSARWHQLKPHDDLLQEDKQAATNALVALKERRTEFDELLKTATQLKSDCEHFGLPPPEFPLVDELQADISKHEEMWSLYEEFSNGLDELCKEDWISFRYNTCSDTPLFCMLMLNHSHQDKQNVYKINDYYITIKENKKIKNTFLNFDSHSKMVQNKTNVFNDGNHMITVASFEIVVHQLWVSTSLVDSGFTCCWCIWSRPWYPRTQHV